MNTKSRADSEDEDDILTKPSLEFFVNSMTYNEFILHIDEPVLHPSYYRKVSEAISQAKQGDLVRIKLSSPGGRLDGCVVLLDAIAKTEATTQAELIGDCSSAASMIALSCDCIHVGPYSTMNVHTARYGSGGKSPDIVSHVVHMNKVTTNLVKNIYEGFLTETEIDSVLEGKEFFFDAEEILERVQKREEYYEKLEAELEQPEPEVTEPKKTKKGK